MLKSKTAAAGGGGDKNSARMEVVSKYHMIDKT